MVVDFQTLSFPTLQMNCVWEELLNFRWQSSGHPPIDPAFVVLKSFQPFINMFRGQPEYVCSDEFRVIISKVDTDFKVRSINKADFKTIRGTYIPKGIIEKQILYAYTYE